MAKTKKKISKKQKYNNFSKDFKNTLGTSLVAAFGFLMAFTWRDVIAAYIEKISSKSPIQGQIIGAIILTIISVLSIIIITRYLIESSED